MDRDQLLPLYHAMLTAREIDRAEQQLTNRGEASFHVSGAGHEAMVALVPHLIDDDWLHCHYRDRALLVARGVSPQLFFENLLCKHQSSSRGRRMSAFFSDPTRNVLSMVTPTGNNALQSVGVAAAVKDRESRPIVLCSVGDGTTQQGEFLEACAEAVREQLPVLFLVEDNQWAISTTTEGKTFYSLPTGKATDLFGMTIHYVDGRDVVTACQQLEPIVRQLRDDRGPAMVVFQVERLVGHTNADDQTIYRDLHDIQRAGETGDPITIFQRYWINQGGRESELQAIREKVLRELAQAETAALDGPEPATESSAKRPIPVEQTHPSREQTGSADGPRYTMREAICEVLRSHLRDDSRVMLYGEDIEDPKGDVFGVTRGLSTEFPQRVLNSPLSESTIVGSGIGRALAGQRPVAFLQFADFIPLAYNQIANELATMFWRTDGQWSAPMIVMVACGAYRPGLGPYHAQTFESILAHTPGIDVVMPSTAGDAAGLLNAAFLSDRPTLFLYPKACLNDSHHTTSTDVDQQFTPLGRSRKVRAGRDLTLVGWGNTVDLCRRTAEALDSVGVETEILDLRCISPWDQRAVIASAEITARLIVVHEDNHSCGVGAEVLATVAEKTRVPVAMRRVTRADTHVPCNFANQLELLPSFERLLATAADLLDLELTWTPATPQEDGAYTVAAIGSAPSDETVIVVEWLVKTGATVKLGDPIASLEAAKNVFDMTSPADGAVEEILVAEGETVEVGAPLLKLKTDPSHKRARPASKDTRGTPVLVRRPKSVVVHLPRRSLKRRPFDVGISGVTTVTGSRLIKNDDLLALHGDRQHASMNADDIFRRTGIENRHWAGADQDAVSMAVRASWKLLDQENLSLDDIDLLICSTTSPMSVTPSMACRVLSGLSGGKIGAMLQAFDINAACSGYLYAMQAGYDYLQSTPEGRVLIVTAEVLSPLLDRNDLDTAILFGDATSASILYGESHFQQAKARIHRPDLSARGEDGTTLSVPFRHAGFIQMQGRKVFSEAVRAMVASLNHACQRLEIDVSDLTLVVPHQANQRIIDAIERRVSVPVYSNIREYGNTSSSSIPLCLHDVLPRVSKGEQIGLCAFGGGLTFGAGILEAA